MLRDGISAAFPQLQNATREVREGWGVLCGVQEMGLRERGLPPPPSLRVPVLFVGQEIDAYVAHYSNLITTTTTPSTK
jgi:hypothetical protein